MLKPQHADLLEDFCKDKLPADDILVPPELHPLNPEDEDDVVPNQHAAFGVQKATQKVHEPAWRDLGLTELMNRGPDAGSSGAGVAGPVGGNRGGRGGSRRRGRVGGMGKGLPR